MPIQFLETLVDCDLAHPRDAFNLHLGQTQTAVLGDEEDDARRHCVRRVVVNEPLALNLLCDEFCETGQLHIHVKAATESFHEEHRRGLAKLLASHIRLAAVDVVENRECHTASARRTGAVEAEYLGDFVGRARAAVHAAGDINGRRFDAVAIQAAEHFLLRNVLVDNHGVVNEDLGNARVLRHVADELELVVEGLFFMRHRLPLRPFLDLLHLIGCARAA